MAELHPRPIIPFLVAAGGIACFSLMDVAMKSLSLDMGAYNAMYWRSVLGTMLSAILFAATGGRLPSTGNLKIHLLRSFLVSIFAILFFWGITVLPLAEAIGLSFIAPVIALYFAAILLGETIGKEALIASASGIAGIIIIVAAKFSGNYDPLALWGTAAVMASAVLFAVNLIIARKQAQRSGPVEIVFFANLFVVAWLSLAAPWFLQPFALPHIPQLSGAALLSIISLLLLSWAYARAEAQVLIPVEYTGFAWAALFGWLFFSEKVTLSTIAGTAMIVTGAVIAARAKPKLVVATELG
ncbi:DMT family transporter [Sphingorhabdus arenilitoris]|uniref:DMT family transporter n=1 Tax=Sphingorhabdus arenilitoris TaxID=1490041 RepID=A0ABV8RCP3_9SPHN